MVDEKSPLRSSLEGLVILVDRIGVRRIASKALLGNVGEVIIDHEGGVYRLRRTRQGKLILTK